MFTKNIEIPTTGSALPGRGTPLEIKNKHFVLNVPIQPPFPDGVNSAIFGMGCFWGAEKSFWEMGGIYTTAAGYSAGTTPNPTYEEVCSGKTGHNEVVLVAWHVEQTGYMELLRVFWEAHNPTQGMRQGNDMGTQYRSGIYYLDDEQRIEAEQSLARYQQSLDHANYGRITTEILPAAEFYYAEDYHQQYLAKNPNGYCGLGGTGVCLASP
jgi:peptide-methionine (S)-S-oxide reductase